MKNKKPVKDKELIKLTKKMKFSKKQAKVYRYGIEVFGKESKFNSWLSIPNVALGGQIPEDLMKTEEGLEEVNNILVRIEHGIIS